MTITIALLRGINVGGKRMKMADLRDMFADLGFPDTRTLLQTGNVVFKADTTDKNDLIQRIEAAIIKKFGFDSKIILRTYDELKQVFENSPFSVAQLDEPRKAAVIFLSDTPDVDAISALMDAHDGPETVTVQGREVFAFYPEGMGRSKFDHKLVEKKLGVNGTNRNWNTVTKLVALADEVAS